EGEVRVVTLVEFRRESGWGSTMEMPLDEDTPVMPMEALTDEVIRLQDTSERPAWEPRPDRAKGRPATGERAAPRPLPVVNVPDEPVDEPNDTVEDEDDVAGDGTA